MEPTIEENQLSGNLTYEIDLTPIIGNLAPELVPSAMRYLADIGHRLINLAGKSRNE